MTPLRRPSGYTIIEVVSALALIATLIATLVWASMSMIRRQDEFLADRTLDRAASAQLAHALSSGWYAYGDGGSSADLTARLPRQLTRDLAFTHGEAVDTRMVSVAVGQEGTLILATVTPERACKARRYTSPTADEFAYETVEVAAGEACIAAGFLAPDEPPAWVVTDG